MIQAIASKWLVSYLKFTGTSRLKAGFVQQVDEIKPDTKNQGFCFQDAGVLFSGNIVLVEHAKLYSDLFSPGLKERSLDSSGFSAEGTVISDTAPVYLSDLLRVYSPSRQLRSSSDSITLRIPHIRTKTFGHRSFSHAAPSVWNSLPHEIRHIQSANAFKTALKTHLFKSYLC